MKPKVDPSLESWYDARVRELRKTGMKIRDARDKAAEECEVAAPTPSPADQSDSDYWQDLIWVYHNIARKTPDLAGSPSFGARGLLSWAKEEPKAFYTEYFRTSAKRQTGDDNIDVRNDARKTVAEIDEMLDALHRQSTEDLIAELTVPQEGAAVGD